MKKNELIVMSSHRITREQDAHIRKFAKKNKIPFSQALRLIISSHILNSYGK